VQKKMKIKYFDDFYFEFCYYYSGDVIMDNKVLIKLVVPEINQEFDIYIPVNELVWKIKKLVTKCIKDLSENNFDFSKEYILINVDTNQIYNENDIVINTDIRNATKLILISEKQIEL